MSELLSDTGKDASSGQKQLQLERVLSSRTFLSAPQLRRFLEYIGTAALAGHADAIKEYTIGTQVFARRDFDPRTDTFVRTQGSRLRSRLEQYYSTEGAADEILIQMPRGSYVPRFVQRGVVSKQEQRPPRLGRWIAASVVILLVAAGVYWVRRGAPDRGPVAQLWSRFAGGQTTPIICYSNHTSLINDSLDQVYYYGTDTMPKGTQLDVSHRDLPINDRRLLKYMGPVFFNDGNTGTGEVVGVSNLTRVFTQLGSQLIVKRSRLLSSADLNRHDVIFLGSPTAHNLLKALPASGEFQFDGATAHPGIWAGRILNRQPKPGESPVYAVERDPASKALRADHALVSVLPGIAPGRHLAVLAGVTTEGTQAAADFATTAAGLAQIAARLGGAQLPPYFQAVLRVEIANGDVLRIQYVTGRVIRPAS